MSLSRSALLIPGGLVSLIVGVFILAYFCVPTERSQVNYDEMLTVGSKEYRHKDFGYYSGWDNVASFYVLSGTVKSCEPLTEALFLDWQAGRYEPNWTEMDHGTYEYRRIDLSPGLVGPSYGRYFLFFNTDSYDKIVHIQVTAHWTEYNTANLSIGMLLIIVGIAAETGFAAWHILKTRTRTHQS
jgi:hypothetical protein